MAAANAANSGNVATSSATSAMVPPQVQFAAPASLGLDTRLDDFYYYPDPRFETIDEGSDTVSLGEYEDNFIPDTELVTFLSCYEDKGKGYVLNFLKDRMLSNLSQIAALCTRIDRARSIQTSFGISSCVSRNEEDCFVFPPSTLEGDYNKKCIALDDCNTNWELFCAAPCEIEASKSLECSCQICARKKHTNMAHWLIDNGTSNHFTNDINDYTSYTKFNVPRALNTADKSSNTFVYGYGDIYIKYHEC